MYQHDDINVNNKCKCHAVVAASNVCAFTFKQQ